VSDRRRILVIGGYGTFGGRIVALVEDEPRLTLLVAGRSLPRADAFCRARRTARATLTPVLFDRDGDVAAQLGVLQPEIVVDASGPFQFYGGAPYRVIEACIARGVDYLDLADGSEFVAGVGAFDAAARAAGSFVLSGVSSFPVLTAAVVRRLAAGMARVERIEGGIAPSPFAGVGENVIRAIASYAGRPTTLRRRGADVVAYSFTEQRRFTIAPPGRLPLRSTMFSLVDVPDLRSLTELWPEAEDVWIGAGPVPEILHRALMALAWLVRAKVLPTLSPLAPLMYAATNHLRWGEHRGGMFVAVEGRDKSGAPVARSWHLLAEGDDGPLIPSMAVEALLRRAVAGSSPPPGARAALLDLELADYEALFRRRTIHTGLREETADRTAPLFARLLGAAWDALPLEVRHMHTVDRIAKAQGRARVDRGTSVLAHLIGHVMGFPKAAADTPVEVEFRAADGAETWTRKFGADRFSSVQIAGEGLSERLLCERFGALTFAMALVVEGGRLSLVMRRWSLFGVPLPLWLCPRSDSYETVEDGRFHFHVEIGHPLAGLIIRYRGWLVPTRGDDLEPDEH
jgi:Domain of unknown function (DUF4166)/Saccharopine dehydrogenase NADP binding domain